MANAEWIVYSPIDLVLPPIKITERSQATNIELGLQIPSGGVILTFDLLYFSVGSCTSIMFMRFFVDALNANSKHDRLQISLQQTVAAFTEVGLDWPSYARV